MGETCQKSNSQPHTIPNGFLLYALFFAELREPVLRWKTLTLLTQNTENEGERSKR